MLFNSIVFLYFFLPVTYVVFWKLHTLRSRHAWLAATGYVFYGAWNPKYCLLMLFSTVVSFAAGLGLAREQREGVRRAILVLAVVSDLSLLWFFKYYTFFADGLNSLLGPPLQLPLLDVVLPVGISFYVFHTITYVVDVHRGAVKPTRSFVELACYVSLFAQLVAGPIVRFRQIEADLESLDRAERRQWVHRGLSFFVLGLAKKCLIADSIAAMVDPAFENYSGLSTAGAWLCALGYTYQLYFDFSGYSDMAYGLAHLFSLRLPQNFDSPYRALSPADFWRRWHISLSTFLRDYLYIPLGGDRRGRGRTLFNLTLTMFLGGLWHGANWTFVVWGLYHGVLLVLHRIAAEPWRLLPRAVQAAITFLAVVLGWVIFRSDTLAMAGELLGKMFAFDGTTLPGAGGSSYLALVAAVALAHAGPNTFELPHGRSTAWVATISLLFVACMVSLYSNREAPFLYFQF